MTARDRMRLLLGHVLDDLCELQEKHEALQAENAELRAQLEEKEQSA